MPPGMLHGDRIRLRAIEQDDLPMLVAWRNDPAVHAHFFEHEPLSLAMQQRWYERFLQRDDEKYWIAETHDGENAEPVGTVALVGIDLRNRHAELGRVLVYPPGKRGEGIGRETCSVALRYAFDHLNLERVFCEVFADNASAIGLYEKLGFRREGLLRRHVFKDGAYRDVVLMGMLRDSCGMGILPMSDGASHGDEPSLHEKAIVPATLTPLESQ